MSDWDEEVIDLLKPVGAGFLLVLLVGLLVVFGRLDWLFSAEPPEVGQFIGGWTVFIVAILLVVGAVGWVWEKLW